MEARRGEFDPHISEVHVLNFLSGKRPIAFFRSYDRPLRRNQALGLLSVLLLLILASIAAPEAGHARVLVSGKVVDESGGPIEGAVVRMETIALDTSITAKGTSNGKGKFQMLMPHPAGAYFFRVTAEGYEPHEELVELGLERTELTAPIRRRFELRMAADETVMTMSPAAGVYSEGVVAFDAEDYELARELFAEATREDPELVEAWIGVGRVAYVEGDFRGALEAVASLGEMDAPKEVLELREDAYLALGERDAAKAIKRELKKRGR